MRWTLFHHLFYLHSVHFQVQIQNVCRCEAACCGKSSFSCRTLTSWEDFISIFIIICLFFCFFLPKTSSNSIWGSEMHHLFVQKRWSLMCIYCYQPKNHSTEPDELLCLAVLKQLLSADPAGFYFKCSGRQIWIQTGSFHFSVVLLL